MKKMTGLAQTTDVKEEATVDDVDFALLVVKTKKGDVFILDKVEMGDTEYNIQDYPITDIYSMMSLAQLSLILNIRSNSSV